MQLVILINNMLNISGELKVKYKDKPLIVPDYASRKKEYYSVDDFKDFEWLMYYLGEVKSHEASMKKEGLEFFKEAFGLENLAQLLYDNQWFKEEFKNSNEIVEWLKWWDNESKTY